MVRNDPVKKILRRLYLSLGILTLFIILLISFTYVVNPSGHPIGHFPVVLMISALLLLFVVSAVLQYFLKRVEKRRSRALQEGQRVLAAEQPIPDEMALPVPTTFQFSLRRRYFLYLASGIIMGGIIVLLVSGIAFSTSTAQPRGWLIFSISAGIFLVVLLPLVFLYFSLKSRLSCRVYIDERGITSTYYKMTTHVDWSEARLFAVNTVK